MMRTLLIGALALLVGPTVLTAPAVAKPLYNTPVFNPSTQSYFELVDVHDRKMKFHMGYSWSEAEHDAQTREFKNARGRLALPTSLETHEFLYKTFRPDTPAWIGLRYLCETHTLVDAAGRNVGKPAFAPWAANWKADPYICVINPATKHLEPGDFMPVAYTSMNEGFRWVGKTTHKVYDAYFIEYPTGHE